MTKYRIKIVNEGKGSVFYPQVKILGIWFHLKWDTLNGKANAHYHWIEDALLEIEKDKRKHNKPKAEVTYKDVE